MDIGCEGRLKGVLLGGAYGLWMGGRDGWRMLWGKEVEGMEG